MARFCFWARRNFLIAILFGATLMAFCRVFPVSILGVLVAVSGLELALVTRDQIGRTDSSGHAHYRRGVFGPR